MECPKCYNKIKFRSIKLERAKDKNGKVIDKIKCPHCRAVLVFENISNVMLYFIIFLTFIYVTLRVLAFFEVGLFANLTNNKINFREFYFVIIPFFVFIFGGATFIFKKLKFKIRKEVIKDKKSFDPLMSRIKKDTFELVKKQNEYEEKRKPWGRILLIIIFIAGFVLFRMSSTLTQMEEQGGIPKSYVAILFIVIASAVAISRFLIRR